MYDAKPNCTQSSGSNLECNIQYQSVSSLKLDIPTMPEGIDTSMFQGLGQSDTGHAMCVTCGASWAYTLINGQVTFIPRVQAQQPSQDNTQNTEGDCDCADCKP